MQLAHLRRRAALVGLPLAGLLLALIPSAILPGAPARADDTAPAVPTVDDGRLLLVLDSSGSMREPASGGTKIAAAKRALQQVIGGLDPQAQVGLRVYGAEVFSRDQPGACTDSQLAVPVGAGNAARLSRAVDRYRPYGETPIGYALRQAADDLGSDGQRSILLVSDGEATCPPDPCRVAAQLARDGVEVRIDVVGLAVAGAARSQLQCIAAKGGGSYFDADSADDLVATLDRLSTRAFRPFAVAGQPVTGTATAADAPALAPGATYTDVVPTGADAKHYLVERTIPGSTLRVSLAARPDTETSQVTLDLLDAEEDTCASGTLTAFGLGSGTQLLSGDVVSGERCPPEGPVVVRMAQSTFGEESGGTAAQLLVTEEPPVADSSTLPGPVEPAEAVDPWREGAAVEAPVPGSSFNDAPLLAPGAYDSSLVPGEIQFFRVPVGWGQQLQAQVRMPTPGDALADAIGSVRPVDVLLYSPSYADVGDAGRGIVDATGPTVQTNVAHQVGYRNRESTAEPRNAAVAGEYFVAVALAGDSTGGDGESFVVPYTLAVRTAGVETGAPAYVEAGIAPSPSASATEPVVPSDGPSGDAAGQAGAGDPEAAADEPGSRVLLWLVVGAIALLVGGLAVGAALSARRRRP